MENKTKTVTKAKTFRKHPQSQRQWKTRPCKLCKYLILNFGHFLEECLVDNHPTNNKWIIVQSASGRWTLDRQIFGTSSQSWKLRWSESMIHSPTHKVTEFPNQLPVLVYHYQYLLIVVVSIPQDLQIAPFVLIPSMNFRQMWFRPVIVLFWTPAVDEMASKTFSWVEVECSSSRDAHCSHLTSRRLSNWKVTVPSSSLQVTSKLKSWPVHVLGSSVGQMEQSNWCRLTTAGWHSPQPQHFFCRSECNKVTI